MTPAPRRPVPGTSPIGAALKPEVESVWTSPHESAAAEAAAGPQTVERATTAPAADQSVPEHQAAAGPTFAPIPGQNAPAPSTSAPSPSASSTTAPPSVQPEIDWDEKKVTTLRVRRGLKAQAETAVLLTKKLPGGHKSWVALVDEALVRELARLADEFNGGVPFDPNTSEFQTGRLPGS